jgi:hypothetical protein
MVPQIWIRQIAGVLLAGLVSLAACAPIPTIVDTPREAEAVRLSVDQPMQVRWANLNPAEGAWVLERGPATAALKSVGRTVQPPANGAQQLEIFDFTGAAPGVEQLTFFYRHNNGDPPTPEERVTIHVTVS